MIWKTKCLLIINAWINYLFVKRTTKWFSFKLHHNLKAILLCITLLHMQNWELHLVVLQEIQQLFCIKKAVFYLCTLIFLHHVHRNDNSLCRFIHLYLFPPSVQLLNTEGSHLFGSACSFPPYPSAIISAFPLFWYNPAQISSFSCLSLKIGVTLYQEHP